MEGINYNLLPHFELFFGTVAIGLSIALVYFILKKLFLPMFLTENRRERLLGNIRLLEKIFWAVFIAIIAVSLILSHAIVGLTLVLFIGGVLWKSINNYLLGLIFQMGNKYKIGQIIRYGETQGTIRAFNNRSLELELEGGEYLDLPYRLFAGGPVFRPSSKSGIMSHPVELLLPKPCQLEREENRIRHRLLSLPWVLPNQKIVFEHLADEPTHYKIRVTLYGIDLNHLYKAEQVVKGMYEGGKEVPVNP
ncbi:MAG: mechanosensitive ion channel family protein [Bacteroidetes bacterium]|nr:MAG: mechanosensitive ion channel family protein [Bacteroidota bacterium]